MKHVDKQKQRKIALEQVIELFSQAKEAFPKDSSLAKRYVSLARKIATKIRLRLPARLKRQFCRHCGSYLFPGRNLRVRLQGSKVVYYCLECKHFMRFPYTRERKNRLKSLP